MAQVKCTGTPTTCNKHDYPAEYRVKDKYSKWHTQCNSIVIITVEKAKRAKAELEVESSFVDLFGLDSSQSQRSDAGPPSPPCRRRKRRLEERHDVANDNEDGGGDDGGGGKRCGDMVAAELGEGSARGGISARVIS